MSNPTRFIRTGCVRAAELSQIERAKKPHDALVEPVEPPCATATVGNARTIARVLHDET